MLDDLLLKKLKMKKKTLQNLLHKFPPRNEKLFLNASTFHLSLMKNITQRNLSLNFFASLLYFLACTFLSLFLCPLPRRAQMNKENCPFHYCPAFM